MQYLQIRNSMVKKYFFITNKSITISYITLRNYEFYHVRNIKYIRKNKKNLHYSHYYYLNNSHYLNIFYVIQIILEQNLIAQQLCMQDN